MTNAYDIEIEYFGAFSRFKDETPLILKMPANSTIQDLKTTLFNALSEFDDGKLEGLIISSAIADDYRIYNKDETINKSGRFAILPPVNGG